LRQAVSRALVPEIAQRAQRLSSAQSAAFQLSEHGKIWWEGAPVARLMPGPTVLSPRTEIIADDMLVPVSRERVQARLELWLREHIAHILAPLAQLAAAEDLEGLARGLAFQIVEQLGNLPRSDVADTVRGLDQPARAALRRYGIRFGAHSVFLPALLKPAAASLKVLLWSVQARAQDPGLRLPPMPAPGLVSVPIEAGAPGAFYERAGFRPCGVRAVRIDMLERLADLLRPPKALAAITPIAQKTADVPGDALSPAEAAAENVESEETATEEAPALPEVAPPEAGPLEEPALLETPPLEAVDTAPVAEPTSAETASAEPPTAEVAAEAVPQPTKPTKASAVAPDGSFSVTAEMMSIVGTSGVEFEALLRSLGFRARQDAEGKLSWRMGRRRDPAENRPQTRREDRPQTERRGERRNEDRGEHRAGPRDEAGRERRPEGDPNREARRDKKSGPRPDRGGERRAGEGEPPREQRPHHHQKPKHAGAKHGGPKPGGPERGAHEAHARPRPHKPAEKPLDPTSPFAKLAILKEAMTKGR
jgi:ATP-dependent RNA helicase SUPV3L1/SUV3